MANNWSGKTTGIGFWDKESGNSTSMTLSEGDIAYLQTLQAGDRLNLYFQDDRKTDKSPHRVLRRFWREGETMPNGKVYHDTYAGQKGRGPNAFGYDSTSTGNDDGI